MGGIPMALTVNVGSLQVNFENTSDWFPRSIYRNGSGVSTLNTSVNGCVLQFNGVFIGGDHLFSSVVNTHLTVDGERKEFVNGSSYTGTTATFSRTIDYSGTILLDHTMMIRNDRIDESYTARTINSGVNITTFYASLRSFENRFSGYRVYNASGLLCASGNLILNDDNNTAAVQQGFSVHMFDVTRGHNVVTNFSFPLDINHRIFIDDRPNDNKLYISSLGWLGLTTDKTYHWSQSLRFF